MNKLKAKKIKELWYKFFNEKRTLYMPISYEWDRLLPYFLQKELLTIVEFNEAKKRWW